MTKQTENAQYPAIQFRIARPTRKLKELVFFYTQGLQLQVLSSFEGHADYCGVMIGLPGLSYHLEFTQDENGTEGRAPTKDNLLVLYFPNIEALNTIRHSLERLGHQPVAPENPYWQAKSWTYEDPDGWRVVLYDGLFLM